MSKYNGTQRLFVDEHDPTRFGKEHRTRDRPSTIQVKQRMMQESRTEVHVSGSMFSLIYFGGKHPGFKGISIRRIRPRLNMVIKTPCNLLLNKPLLSDVYVSVTGLTYTFILSNVDGRVFWLRNKDCLSGPLVGRNSVSTSPSVR